eukprot:SAG11_NODE_22720_length_401_cov_0.824503_1_plen_125_part_10
MSAADGGRWGALLPGETILSVAQLQAAGLPKPRPGLGLALGWLDKHMVGTATFCVSDPVSKRQHLRHLQCLCQIVDPFSNTTIVTFGQTLGGSRLCGEHYQQGDGQRRGRWETGFDGAFSASLVW